MNKKERYEAVIEMIENEKIAITMKDGLQLIYHWYMYEQAMITCKHAHRRLDKHADALNNTKKVLEFRAELADLI